MKTASFIVCALVSMFPSLPQGGARFGMGPRGEDEFECGGVLELPGMPFCLSATNVN